jgi:hypothetical protein
MAEKTNVGQGATDRLDSSLGASSVQLNELIDLFIIDFQPLPEGLQLVVHFLNTCFSTALLTFELRLESTHLCISIAP